MNSNRRLRVASTAAILSLCVFLSATILRASDGRATVAFAVAVPTDVEVADHRAGCEA